MSFVESKARALNHPVFGTINTECRNQGNTSNNRRPRHFATLGSEPISENNEHRSDSMRAKSKCHLCKDDHWLTRCGQFKKQSMEQRLTFARKQGLCENCFQHGHKVKSCPKTAIAKFPLAIQRFNISAFKVTRSQRWEPPFYQRSN